MNNNNFGHNHQSTTLSFPNWYINNSILTRIATNDPSFTQMDVCTSGNECHEYLVSDTTTDQTLEMLGGLIGRNTTLKSIGIMQFDVYEEDDNIAVQRADSSCESLVGGQVVSFCKGFDPTLLSRN